MKNPTTLDSADITASVVRALFLYSLAEFQTGNCTTIRLTAEGRSFSIEDDGRGHAINRTVAQTPYLKFVYTHLDYPFAPARSAEIQLHGIGMSLINTLCAELTVMVRKKDATYRLSYRHGALCDDETIVVTSEVTGNTISGTVDSRVQEQGVDARKLLQWLNDVQAAHPVLKLFFNGSAC